MIIWRWAEKKDLWWHWVYCCHKGGYYCMRGILGMYENGFLAGCWSEVVLVLVASGCWIFSEDTSASGENKGE